MEKLTDDQKLARLGLGDRATTENHLNTLGTFATEAECKPGVLDILERDAATKLRDKFSYGDESLLADDALARATRAERLKWIGEFSDKATIAEDALPVLRRRIEASIARQQELSGEAESVKPESRVELLTARMLDTLAEAEARRWLDSLTPEAALAEYEASADDSAGRAFVRQLEWRFRKGLLDLSASKDPLGMAGKFREAVTARRDARVRQSDRDALVRLDQIAMDVRRSRMSIEAERGKLAPNGRNVQHAAAQLLAHAGKRGTEAVQ